MAKYLFVIKNPVSNAGLLTVDVEITDVNDNTTTLSGVPDTAYGQNVKSNIIQATIKAYNGQVPAPVPLIGNSDFIEVFGNPTFGTAGSI